MKNFLAPIIGTIVGLSLVVWSIMSSGPMDAFIDLPSLTIVFFGSMAAVFASTPLPEFLKIPKNMRDIFAEGDDEVEMIQTIIEFSRRARVNGILSIEEEVRAQDNDLLVTGLQMVIDGKDGESIQEFLELEMMSIEEEYSVAPSVFNRWGGICSCFWNDWNSSRINYYAW